MKKILITFLFVVFCWCQVVYSEENIVADTPTGDSELDQSIEELSKAAKEDISGFARKLSRKYNLPEETTDWLLKRVGMSPGDAYMAAKVSKISKQPVEDVVKEYEANPGKGWGVIAKKLGIKPGSKEFHELKRDDSGILSEYKDKGKKVKNKGKKTKGKGKKTVLTEDDQQEVEKGEIETKEKGFLERWFGSGKKEKEKTKK